MEGNGFSMDVLDRPALVAGTLTALAVVVPATILGELAGAGDGESNLVFVFLLAVLTGFGAGAYVAARRAETGPLTNGALAAVAAFAIVQGVGSARRLVVGEPISLASIAFAALLAYSCGLVGAAVARRRAGVADAR
jgi:hypothetical protein